MTHSEKNLDFLLTNKEVIVAEIVDTLDFHPFNKYNVTLKNTMDVLLKECDSYSIEYSLDNLSNLVCDAIVTFKDNRNCTMHSEDFAKIQSRRQAINL